jgi:hypothetical protein
VRLAIVLFLLACLTFPANGGLSGSSYHDTTRGWISCNGVATHLGSALGVKKANGKVAVLLFKSPMNDERLQFWKASYPATAIPSHLNSFANLEITFAKGTTDVESYFFYAGCPATQVNLNRSAAFDPARMKREVALGVKDGRLTLRTKADKPQTLMSVTVDWSLDVDTTLFDSK